MVATLGATPHAARNILYLVHDLADPAVRRRVMMLQAGGATVTLAGFRRPGKTAIRLPALKVVELGVTYDARMAHRIAAVARACVQARRILSGVAKPDVILARNLEMLAVARSLRSSLGGGDVPLVYESLDIHRLLLRGDVAGASLRGLERWLARDADLLITSSPAFVRNYFDVFRTVAAPVALVENKHLELMPAPGPPARPETPPPWRIGWFGAIRCSRSLDMLAAFVGGSEGRYQGVIRGIPAPASVPQFQERVYAEPGLSFLGPYRNPEDIASIYGSVHFAWAIDLYEEGANSEWLLPNRLYEGCRFGAVPIALARTETGRYLAERKIGVLLQEPTVECLSEVMARFDAADIEDLRAAVIRRPLSSWIATQEDCQLLVQRLIDLQRGRSIDSTLLQEASL